MKVVVATALCLGSIVLAISRQAFLSSEAVPNSPVFNERNSARHVSSLKSGSAAKSIIAGSRQVEDFALPGSGQNEQFLEPYAEERGEPAIPAADTRVVDYINSKYGDPTEQRAFLNLYAAQRYILSAGAQSREHARQGMQREAFAMKCIYKSRGLELGSRPDPKFAHDVIKQATKDAKQIMSLQIETATAARAYAAFRENLQGQAFSTSGGALLYTACT